MSLIVEMTNSLVTTSSTVKSQLSVLNISARPRREKISTNLYTEAAFFACLNDNNRIRQKFGLENVLASKYLITGSESWHETMSTTSTGLRDEFFDAEEGEISDENSSGSESLHDCLEIDIVDDESDLELKTSNVNLLSRQSTPSTTLLTLVRRISLPVPAGSMENISIMGILRNNVGKDLSTGIKRH